MNVQLFSFEKWSEKHIPDLVRHADNPAVSDNLRNIFPSPYTEEDARTWISICSAADENIDYNRAIVIDGEAAGGIGITRQADVCCRTAELGYWLGEEFWGRGIMPEAVRRICERTFLETDIVRIFAGPFARNRRSRRVLEKAGFTLEGIHRMEIYKNGCFDDSCMYALLKEDIGS